MNKLLLPPTHVPCCGRQGCKPTLLIIAMLAAAAWPCNVGAVAVQDLDAASNTGTHTPTVTAAGAGPGRARRATAAPVGTTPAPAEDPAAAWLRKARTAVPFSIAPGITAVIVRNGTPHGLATSRHSWVAGLVRPAGRLAVLGGCASRAPAFTPLYKQDRGKHYLLSGCQHPSHPRRQRPATPVNKLQWRAACRLQCQCQHLEVGESTPFSLLSQPAACVRGLSL